MLRFYALWKSKTILNKYYSTPIMAMDRPAWVKDKKVAEDFEVIRTKAYDDYKDHRNDDGCYVLIRVYWDTHEIGVAICDYKHTILKEFRGKRAQDIYVAIFKYDEQNNKNWFKVPDHAAYLGKELKKAEICLALGTEYIQE